MDKLIYLDENVVILLIKREGEYIVKIKQFGSDNEPIEPTVYWLGSNMLVFQTRKISEEERPEVPPLTAPRGE